MRFSTLAKYLERLDTTQSRNEITKILADLFRGADAEEIDKVCYLILGELLPAYRGVEFNIAEKIMVNVLALAYNKSPAAILRIYKSRGDIGNVAYELSGKRAANVKKEFSVKYVYDLFLGVAHDSGTGSQERKVQKMAELIRELDARSAKYASRIPAGKLRLGFSDITVLDALSTLVKGDKSARAIVENGYNVMADIGAIAELVKKRGLRALGGLRPKPGMPIRPSLAERLRNSSEVFEKAGRRVGVEPKLDGFRTQIHVIKEGRMKRVSLFSRNMENTTPMFPEIVASAEKLAVDDIILDGETIGYDATTGKFAPFQETVQRKRKYDVQEFAKKIPLGTFVFDILHLNGRALLNLPFEERRKLLEKVFARVDRKSALRLSNQMVTSDLGEIERALKESVERGLEGLVVKNLSSPYQAGSRGFHWIKLKATTSALEKLREGSKTANKILDTVDCLVMGAYKGRGKRARFGIGGFLLGARRDDKFYTISRLGSGLSDEQLREARRKVEKLKAKEMPKEYVVEKDLTPDIWVRPSLILEILADEISLSQKHAAGKKGEGRGYSLRFPRLVRFREDKSPEDVTTVSEIKKMYLSQKKP